MSIDNIMKELENNPAINSTPQIDDLMMQTAMAQMERAELNDEQLERARATVEQIKAIMDDYRVAVSHITADARLSPAGKQTDLATAKEKADERLAHEGDDRLKVVDARIAELEYESRPQQPDAVCAVRDARLFAAVPLQNENHSPLNGSFRAAAPARGAMPAQV